MYLLDEADNIVDSEFSLDILDDEPCIIVESSGGANPAHGANRRNPEYNKLIGLLFQRLRASNNRVTRVVLDSKLVANIPLAARTAKLKHRYPIDLSTVDIDDLRRSLGRAVASMHRKPNAKSGGNAQKRLRICTERPTQPGQLVAKNPEDTNAQQKLDDHTPGMKPTEKAYLRSARLGQGPFRTRLLADFSGACPVHGISNESLLIASHIKPWSASSNLERLDPDNGILLSALIDRLFDRGLITFKNDGTIKPSPQLCLEDRTRCRIDNTKPIHLSSPRLRYMRYHAAFVFQHA